MEHGDRCLPGRWASTRGRVPVEPAVVVEIETDCCFELGRYRHAVRFIRVRTELDPADIAT
jgi:hypothetical protein